METTGQLFIGDVHGCSLELDLLLERAGYHPGMDVFFVGDLICRGPDSVGVLNRFKELEAQAVLGNHERAFLKYLTRKPKDKKPAYDLLAKQLGEQLEYWVEQMSSWPLFIETKDWLMVHAGLQPERHPKNTSPRLLTKIRTWDGKGNIIWRMSDPPWYQFYKEAKPVIFGHWATGGLIVRSNAIGLDTGCVYGGKLSAMLFPERQIFQVQAQQVYAEPRYKPGFSRLSKGEAVKRS